MKPFPVVVDVLHTLESMGFGVTPRPDNDDGMPVLPADPTELDDKQLMDFFFCFTEWTSYAQTQLASAVAQERGAEIEAARVKARALPRYMKGTVTAAKAAAAEDADVVAAENNLYRVYCVRVLMEPVLARAERSAAALSRELSRRGARASVDRRASKWGA